MTEPQLVAVGERAEILRRELERPHVLAGLLQLVLADQKALLAEAERLREALRDITRSSDGETAAWRLAWSALNGEPDK